jgi:hypothetical protein
MDPKNGLILLQTYGVPKLRKIIMANAPNDKIIAIYPKMGFLELTRISETIPIAGNIII